MAKATKPAPKKTATKSARKAGNKAGKTSSKPASSKSASAKPKPPWDRADPRKRAGKATRHLSPAKKAAAKARAKRAGRPYPNLVDNMRAASPTKSAAKKKSATSKSSAKASGKKTSGKTTSGKTATGKKTSRTPAKSARKGGASKA